MGCGPLRCHWRSRESWLVDDEFRGLGRGPVMGQRDRKTLKVNKWPEPNALFSTGCQPPSRAAKLHSHCLVQSLAPHKLETLDFADIPPNKFSHIASPIHFHSPT
jgi:hypothetical protein